MEKHMEKCEIPVNLAKKYYYNCSMLDYAPITKQTPKF